MELYGARWLRPVATGRKSPAAETGETSQTVGADEFEGAFAAVRASPVWSSRRMSLFQTGPFGEASV
jgi:hypothetical protein